MREAVEHLYDKLLNEGNTLVLQSGEIQQFMKQLRESTLEDNRNGNFSDYVAERIKDVKKTGSIWKITTQEIRLAKGKYLESEQKDINSVSKIMKTLRERKPLPL